MLTLGWSDGNSFLPINFSLLSSHKESNQLGVMDMRDGRTIAGKRRAMAVRKAIDVMLELLDAAIKAGHQAKYVLFDTWFANPHQIVSIKGRNRDTIAMVKKSSKITYEFEGEHMNSKQIFKQSKKRRGRSRYLLSVEILVGKDNGADEHPIPDRLVYAIVMVRCMILSIFQRQDQDQRALGELFYVMLTELEDITFQHSMLILLEAMFQTVKTAFRVTEEQLEAFAADFYSRLPEYMQRALNYTPFDVAEAICHG
ncbi:MAG: transposase [Anaerovoracaceae bacterium]